MRTLSIIFFSGFAVFASEAVSARDVAYRVIPEQAHSKISFRVCRKVLNARISDVVGYFRDFEGELRINAENPTKSQISIQIRTASIDTGNRTRDEHLRSDDFFRVKDYPIATFRSTEVVPIDKDNLIMRGRLNLVGTPPRKIELKVKTLRSWMDGGKNHQVFSAETTLDRKDFGLTWNADPSFRDGQDHEKDLGFLEMLKARSKALMENALICSDEVPIEIQLEAEAI